MRKLIIFVIETKSDKENSDGVYLRETLEHLYEYDRSNTIVKFVFMNGKGNYNKSSVVNKIKAYVKDSKKIDSNTICSVLYVFDKDNSDTSREDEIFNRNVMEHCNKNGYLLVWMNKNIEEAYWKQEVDHKQKVRMAGKFKTTNEISKIDVARLSAPKANRRYTSNVLLELDKVLERKK